MANNFRAVVLRRRVEELLDQEVESSVQIAEILAAQWIKASDRTIRDDIAIVCREWKATIIHLRDVRQMRVVNRPQRRIKQLSERWNGPKMTENDEKRRPKAAVRFPRPKRSGFAKHKSGTCA
jgi:hypothetical protein